jgi:hypothetical protein
MARQGLASMTVNGQKYRESNGFWLIMARYGPRSKAIQIFSLRSASAAVSSMLNRQ